LLFRFFRPHTTNANHEPLPVPLDYLCFRAHLVANAT